ncbi:MAG: TIGR03619 family F420-dependent LLM class oxidoreductase [Acidobacteria bacterium]|nr:TIGR03619 family F420-dependent LLM class oxidoreductase [Acidobacteriota bacterium]
MTATPLRALLVLSENWTLRPTPTLNDLVDLAVQAEAVGVDGVMMSDHVVLGTSANGRGVAENPRDYAMPGNQDPAFPWPSPYVVLSAIAARTTRLRLVVGALISPLRHPLVTSKDLATLDRLANGRLVVLPTVSWHEEEYAALGVDFHRRGSILDEQLEIWRRAWSGSPFHFHGAHYSFDDVWLESRCVRREGPTLWFGGSSLHPAVIRRLVTFGAGFNPLGQPLHHELLALDQALSDAGRSRDEIEMVGGLRGRFTSPDDVADLDEALEGVAAQVASGYRTFCFKPSMFTDELAEVGRVASRVVQRLGEWN